MTIASVAVFLLVCGVWALFAERYPGTGWDFSQFYIAGSIPLDELYDRAAYEQFGEEELAPLGVNYYPPYVRPAVFALPLKLLTALPYRSAERLFFAFQFALYLVTLWLAFRRFDVPPHLLPAFALFKPALMGIITGQDPHTLALLVFCGFLLLERDHDIAAGLAWALCLYKFNLVIGLPLLLLLRARWKALGAFAAGGACLAVASMALAPPDQYLTMLDSVEDYAINFTPAQMIGLRGISYVTDIPWLYPAAALIVAALSLATIRKATLQTAFTIAVLGSILCSYHANWYDAAILAPCIVAMISEKRGLDRTLPLALIGLLPLWSYLQWIAGALLLLWARLVFASRGAAASGEAPEATSA